jgi:hypothetical protein
MVPDMELDRFWPLWPWAEQEPTLAFEFAVRLVVVGGADSCFRFALWLTLQSVCGAL